MELYKYLYYQSSVNSPEAVVVSMNSFRPDTSVSSIPLSRPSALLLLLLLRVMIMTKMMMIPAMM